MKYLTMESWLAGRQLDSESDPYQPIRAYQAYLDSVRDQLPEEFQRLLAEICLHDARLRELNIDLAARRVILRLDVEDITTQEERRVRLVYEDAGGRAAAAA